MTRRYLQQRHQFGTPLGSFQLQQERLARMAGNVNVSGGDATTSSPGGLPCLPAGVQLRPAARSESLWGSGQLCHGGGGCNHVPCRRRGGCLAGPWLHPALLSQRVCAGHVLDGMARQQAAGGGQAVTRAGGEAASVWLFGGAWLAVFTAPGALCAFLTAWHKHLHSCVCGRGQHAWRMGDPSPRSSCGQPHGCPAVSPTAAPALQASMAKAWNTLRGREVAALPRAMPAGHAAPRAVPPPVPRGAGSKQLPIGFCGQIAY